MSGLPAKIGKGGVVYLIPHRQAVGDGYRPKHNGKHRLPANRTARRSVACITWRMLFEPFDNAWHVRLKLAGYREVENTCPTVTPVLEVVCCLARYEDERALRRIDPLGPDKKAHGAFNDVKDIVLGMGVRARTLRMRIEPPLGDGIATCAFRAISLEHGRDPAHRVRSAATWGKDNSLSRRLGVWFHSGHFHRQHQSGKRRHANRRPSMRLVRLKAGSRLRKRAIISCRPTI